MKHLHTLIQKQITQPPKLQIRNNREQLIADIVNATTEKNKQKLARALAVAANALKWQDSALHTLLQKRNDATIRNYTAFVWGSVKTKRIQNADQ